MARSFDFLKEGRQTNRRIYSESATRTTRYRWSD